MPVRNYDKVYIDGAWVPSSSSESLDVIDSTNEQVMATIPAGTAEDVDKAVAAARAALPDWSAMAADDRAKLLDAVGEGIKARSEEIADVISREAGMAYGLSKAIQIGMPVGSFRTAAEMARTFAFEERQGKSLIVREPIGVVGCITPWNYPLNQIAAKVAYAMAAGCTIVLKPSEVAPVDAMILAEIIDGAGVPKGVFNLVTGDGPSVGEAIARHPDIDMVSFTGSTRAGRRVAALGAETVKKISLELGGKSANVILDDLDDETFAKAVKDGVGKCYLNSGQTCSALTRMLVPRDRLAEAEEIAGRVAETFTVGDPFAEGTKLGPLASAAQRERVRGYISKGVEEGATLVTGGAEAPEGLEQGYYVRPTVFSGVTPDMTIAREEIFGPVLSILPYDGEDEAVRIANDTVYGLAGGVWGGDIDRARNVARRMATGQVSVNGGGADRRTPFGGYKQSGLGREYGEFGFEEFLEVKAVMDS